MDYASEGDLHRQIQAAVEAGGRPLPERLVLHQFCQVRVPPSPTTQPALPARGLDSAAQSYFHSGMKKSAHTGLQVQPPIP